VRFGFVCFLGGCRLNNAHESKAEDKDRFYLRIQRILGEGYEEVAGIRRLAFCQQDFSHGAICRGADGGEHFHGFEDD